MNKLTSRTALAACAAVAAGTVVMGVAGPASAEPSDLRGTYVHLMNVSSDGVNARLSAEDYPDANTFPLQPGGYLQDWDSRSIHGSQMYGRIDFKDGGMFKFAAVNTHTEEEFIFLPNRDSSKYQYVEMAQQEVREFTDQGHTLRVTRLADTKYDKNWNVSIIK